ncbi:hypothetical protein Zmor_011549 [Zophobas morio]|uniref:Uncharacterized protein n=1 Tax=Zophobas morio TaxID=2755281 RepID=A0AA38ML44_9CUCU|nr:hypothetical protein Zmor_011549 [Zophobas morio]
MGIIFMLPFLFIFLIKTEKLREDDSPRKEPAKRLKMEEREQVKQGQEPLMEMMNQLMEEMKQLREENRGIKKELQTINGILEREREEWQEKEKLRRKNQ